MIFFFIFPIQTNSALKIRIHYNFLVDLIITCVSKLRTDLIIDFSFDFLDTEPRSAKFDYFSFSQLVAGLRRIVAELSDNEPGALRFFRYELKLTRRII